MTAITNAENLRHYQSGFYLIAEQTLAFTWSPNMVGKEKNVFKFKTNCVMFYIIKYCHLDSWIHFIAKL